MKYVDLYVFILTWICTSSFWLIPFYICSTLWLVGTDWNLQFGGRCITSKYKFKKNKESYLAKSNCSDVLGLLILMLNTPLEHHSSLSKTTDSLMLAIKASTLDEHSSPDSPNSYGKVNKTFTCVVVVLLAVNLLFDCWYNHSSQTLPAPYASNIPDEIYRDLTYNRKLILNYCICHEIGTTGMFGFTIILLYILSLHLINLSVLRLVTHQLILIVLYSIQIVCSNDVVMISLYMSNLRTFNLYAFLSSKWIYLIFSLSIYIFCCQGRYVFRQSKKQPWPFTTLKKLYALLVTYKGKFTKEIISLFEQYEDF